MSTWTCLPETIVHNTAEYFLKCTLLWLGGSKLTRLASLHDEAFEFQPQRLRMLPRDRAFEATRQRSGLAARESQQQFTLGAKAIILGCMHVNAEQTNSLSGRARGRSWADVVADVPEFAQAVQRILEGRRHHTLATLRKDGSPRVSGIELTFVDGELTLGMMPGSLKLLDVNRNPRIAIHGLSEDPPQEDPSGWAGDVKIAGRLVQTRITEDGTPPSHDFRVEISEVAWTRVGTPADHLVIESWHHDAGFRTRQRV